MKSVVLSGCDEVFGFACDPVFDVLTWTKNEDEFLDVGLNTEDATGFAMDGTTQDIEISKDGHILTIPGRNQKGNAPGEVSFITTIY